MHPIVDKAIVWQMKKELLFFAGLSISGLGLSSCYFDIKDTANLKCKANPQSIVTEKLELITGQTIRINGQVFEISGKGRLRINGSMEITPEGELITGAYNDRRFRVKAAAGADDKTIMTITFNCADPKNP